MKIALIIALLFLNICSYSASAREQTDTIQLVERNLFFLTACNSDVLFVNRPTPCFALLHDTIIIFPTYRDTLAFFNVEGGIVREIYHKFGYPTHLYYNNKQDLLYFLNTGIKGEIGKTYIYTFNKDGIAGDSILFTGKWEKWWLASGAIEQKELQKILPLLKKYKIGGERLSIMVNAISDIQTIWGYYLILGRRDGMNRRTIISLVEKKKQYYTIDPLPRLSSDSACEVENHIWANLYNLRKGYYTSSTNDLLYVWQGHTGFGSSILSIKDAMEKIR